MSLTVDGVWKGGVWASTVWASGVWFEPASAVGGPQAGGGNWFKPRKDKKGKVIRFSDFDSREAYEAALREALRQIPIVHVDHDVPTPTETIDDEDEAILVAISRILH